LSVIVKNLILRERRDKGLANAKLESFWPLLPREMLPGGWAVKKGDLGDESLGNNLDEIKFCLKLFCCCCGDVSN
jgi:hypothetical protein